MSTAGVPTNTGNQANAPQVYDNLKKEYEIKYLEYTRIVGSPSPTSEQIDRLRVLNREISQLLQQMISVTDTNQTKVLDQRYNELSQVLNRIERDHGILSQNSDRLETLRRIREFEEVRTNGTVNIFAVLLLVAALALLIVMIFSAYSTNAVTMSAPTSPAMTENLT